MTMGLRKLDIQKWLLLDKTYRDYYSSRDYLLHYKNNEVIQCLDEGYEAAVELLEEVVIFLTQKYPNHFRIVYQGDQKMVQNRIVKREYGIEKPFDLHPLEICARLAMEDFNLLMKNGKTGQHHLYVALLAVSFISQLTYRQRRKRHSLPSRLAPPRTHRGSDNPASRTGPTMEG